VFDLAKNTIYVFNITILLPINYNGMQPGLANDLNSEVSE